MLEMVHLKASSMMEMKTAVDSYRCDSVACVYVIV
jgi:hypothetical protein